MRKLNEVLRDKVDLEQYRRDYSREYGRPVETYKDPYKSDYDEGYKEKGYREEDLKSLPTKGFKDVEAVRYDEDILLSDEFLEYGITYVKPIKMRSLKDVQRISKELNDGNIVLGDMTPLLQKDPSELKRAIDQIKGICRGIGGDIIGIGDSRVLITPTNIKIWRKAD